jgi:hypothetical protein
MYAKANKIVRHEPRQNEYQSGVIYRVKFDDGCVYIGSAKDTLDEGFRENMNDRKSVVYKNKYKDPEINFICTYPCFSKEELEYCETHYIDMFAKKHGEKVLNVRTNDDKKPKKEIKFECKITKEAELAEKLQKKFPILGDPKNARLQITFK